MAILGGGAFPSQVPTLGVNAPAGAYKVTIKGGNADQASLDNDGSQFTELDYSNNGTLKVTTFWDNTGTAFHFRTLNSAHSIQFDTASTLRLTIRGDGLIQPAAASFTANGAVATTMTSLGPAGASTTVTKWLTIKDDGGTTRYIPCY